MSAPHNSQQHHNPALTERSLSGWTSFMRSVSFAAAAVILILILMAVFLVR